MRIVYHKNGSCRRILSEVLILRITWRFFVRTFYFEALVLFCKKVELRKG
jgi:hypothetical protein